MAVELLGTGNIHYHTRTIENVEPKTLWGGGTVDEDGVMLLPGTFKIEKNEICSIIVCHYNRL